MGTVSSLQRPCSTDMTNESCIGVVSIVTECRSLSTLSFANIETACTGNLTVPRPDTCVADKHRPREFYRVYTKNHRKKTFGLLFFMINATHLVADVLDGLLQRCTRPSPKTPAEEHG